tara:strand:+ start:77 stop:769 length:693 start_codon:yes stop_codon:yes gene_type:complete
MNNTPIFWNTQGKIMYNTDKNFFDYETSMSVNWNNKLARKVLLTIMKIFNRPSILDIKTGGIAIWTYSDLKNTIFYKLPTIFNEIMIRDEYLDTKNTILFLTVSYHLVLNEVYINSLNNYYNYISYDSNKKMLYVKSRTLEENLVVLNTFLNSNKLTKTDIKNKIKNEMIFLNKKNGSDFVNNMKKFISNINTIGNIIQLPKYLDNTEDISSNMFKNDEIVEEKIEDEME